MKIVDSKIKKIVILAIIFMATFMPISNAYDVGNILTQGQGFLEDGKQEGGDEIINQYIFKEEINNIYNILLTIGIALSVLVGAILGIKYMVGSIDEQAKIKETLIPYALGCFVIFGAFGIWKLIIDIGQSIF